MYDMLSAPRDAGRVMPIPRGAFSPNTTYTRLDLVSYQGNSYMCMAETVTGVLPTDTQSWMVYAQGVSASDLIDDTTFHTDKTYSSRKIEEEAVNYNLIEAPYAGGLFIGSNRSDDFSLGVNTSTGELLFAGELTEDAQFAFVNTDANNTLFLEAGKSYSVVMDFENLTEDQTLGIFVVLVWSDGTAHQLRFHVDTDPYTFTVGSSASVAAIVEFGIVFDSQTLIGLNANVFGNAPSTICKLRLMVCESQYETFPYKKCKGEFTVPAHTHALDDIGGGTVTGMAKANTTAEATLGTAQLRNVTIKPQSSTTVTAGVTALTTGEILILYEG